MKRLAIFLIFWCGSAWAEAPRVVTDIAPVHSLVGIVMEGVGEPVLLLDGSSDPHGGALRPSQARALREADVLIWMGTGLTPWLAEAAEGSTAETLALLDWPSTATLLLREEFGGHGHHDDNDDHEGEGHEEHAEHEDEHDHDEHAHDEHGHEKDDHDGEVVDPHAWLDPVNARLWLGEIAAVLGKADPRNAALYGANARAGMAAMKALTAEIEATVAPIRSKPFAVEHDAFHYFEDRFGMQIVAAHSAGDGDRPGPQRMRTLLTRLGEGDIGCLFAEATSSSRMLARVPDGVQVVRLDQLGTTLEPGAALYPALMRKMAGDMTGCLSR